ncbi:MAG: glycosyltransferase [Hyphomicrobiaceae bacterium]|nr:glycosyltransferase [Hyphomicrobiaceae bacterium]
MFEPNEPDRSGPRRQQHAVGVIGAGERHRRRDLPADVPQAAEWLAVATGDLERRHPGASAAHGLAAWQRAAAACAVVLLAAGAWVAPVATLDGLAAIFIVAFISVTVLRVAALFFAVGQPPSRSGALPAISQPIDDAVDTTDLPRYAILVPLYREAEVIEGLVAALGALSYPASKLEISLVLEAGDAGTREAIAAVALPAHFRTVVVPDGWPRTKPRALNYALQSACGELVVVYDAEDAPEPDQLRHAVAAFRDGDERLGCVQARLNISNRHDSFLTRQFTLEYSALFDAILPVLERLGLPIPLGGTSNHFRRDVLEAAGGWDAFNVTEDADLGVRLARQGYGVAILASTTWEEAPADLANWLGQRTRWLKGWMQTYIVHMRQPGVLLRDLGPWRFAGFQAISAAMILSALVHPWFMATLMIWGLDGGREDMSSTTVLWLGLANLIAGYAAAMLLGFVAVQQRGWRGLGLWSLGMPAYWLLISYAAHCALVELALKPFHWAKTRHRARRSSV